ncbi:hypothetical protein WJX84_010422 [Apatococcus fuscideae]|uniref:PPM-type phosphatase domain-containing protein n=1 Tax=Apatococcus fuscideae TaxID=2026836 RepID=A0AAW1TFY2_9CHLO
MLACQDTRLVRTGSKKRTFSEVGGDSGLSALGSHSWGLNQPHHSGQWLVSSTDNTQPACSWLPSSPCGGAHSRGVSAETLDMDTPPDLSALRAAAAAAVADCTDTLREAPSRQSQDATSEQPSSSLPAQKTQFSGGERRRDLSSESDAPTPAAAAAAAPGTSQLKRYSDAFSRTDAEFAKADNAALIGTTAVAALVGSRHLYVANCGDSRAVLCRGGYACALTDDHKAAREDETARVEAAGGQILFWNGVRVMGVLAVSRAIGDHCLRPYVIADPEVTIVARRPEDELLLLASDGLWDKSRPRRDSSGASPSSTGASDHMGRLKLQTQSSHFSSEPSGSSEQG